MTKQTSIVVSIFYLLSIGKIKNYLLKQKSSILNDIIFFKEFNEGFYFVGVNIAVITLVTMISYKNLVGVIFWSFITYALVKNMLESLGERIKYFKFQENELMIMTTKNNTISLPYVQLYFMNGYSLEKIKNMYLSYDRMALVWPELNCHLRLESILIDKKIIDQNKVDENIKKALDYLENNPNRILNI